MISRVKEVRTSDCRSQQRERWGNERTPRQEGKGGIAVCWAYLVLHLGAYVYAALLRRLCTPLQWSFVTFEHSPLCLWNSPLRVLVGGRDHLFLWQPDLYFPSLLAVKTQAGDHALITRIIHIKQNRKQRMQPSRRHLEPIPVRAAVATTLKFHKSQG